MNSEPNSRAAGIFSLSQTIWLTLGPRTRRTRFPAKITAESSRFIFSVVIPMGWGVAPRRDCLPLRLSCCLPLSLRGDYSGLCVVSPGAAGSHLVHSFRLPWRPLSLAVCCNKIFKQEKLGCQILFTQVVMRISRKLQACLTIKQSRESIFRGFNSGAFLGGLPSFLVLIPNTNPLWLDGGGNVHPPFCLCIFL